MKKGVMTVMICLVMTGIVTMGFANGPSVDRPSVKLKPDGKVKVHKRDAGQAQEGLFHLTKLRHSDDRYLLVIGKMPATRVDLRIYDSTGNLVYATSRKAAKDLAKVIVLKEMNGARFTLSDNKGHSRNYMFPE